MYLKAEAMKLISGRPMPENHYSLIHGIDDRYDNLDTDNRLLIYYKEMWPFSCCSAWREEVGESQPWDLRHGGHRLPNVFSSQPDPGGHQCGEVESDWWRDSILFFLPFSQVRLTSVQPIKPQSLHCNPNQTFGSNPDIRREGLLCVTKFNEINFWQHVIEPFH